MVRIQRANLLDPAAPNPSVETLLHAFLPHKFVDHTHANAVLSMIDQPDGETICSELYDGRVGIVPYVMPGFRLAKTAAEVYDAKPAVEGLILHKHGIFTFGDSAREAYERMIALVTLAEERLQKNRKAVFVDGALATGDRAGRRRGADPARRLQPQGRKPRRRVAAHGSRFPRQRPPSSISSTATSWRATARRAW